jgi:hypothetical protein
VQLENKEGRNPPGNFPLWPFEVAARRFLWKKGWKKKGTNLCSPFFSKKLKLPSAASILG